MLFRIIVTTVTPIHLNPFGFDTGNGLGFFNHALKRMAIRKGAHEGRRHATQNDRQGPG